MLSESEDRRGRLVWTHGNWSKAAWLTASPFKATREEYALPEGRRLYYCIRGSVQGLVLSPNLKGRIVTLRANQWMVVGPMEWSLFRRWKKGTILFCLTEGNAEPIHLKSVWNRMRFMDEVKEPIQTMCGADPERIL